MRKLLFIIFALFLALPQALGQQSEEVKRPELRRIIYVPREEFMRVIDPAKQGMVIEFEEYMRLERLAAGVEADEELPPLPAAFSRASYYGSVRDEQAAMFGRIEFSTLLSGWMKISMELDGAALAYPKLDGRDALIRPIRGGVSVYVPEKGDHVLQAMVFAPVEDTPGGKRIAARLPSAPATEVRLDFKGNVEPKSRTAAMSKTYDESSDTTEVRLFLGGTGAFALDYRIEERKTEMNPFIVTGVEQKTVFDGAGSRTAVKITTDSFRAPVDSLQISVERGFQVSNLDATDMLDWSIEAAPRGHLVEIRFRKPINHAVVEMTLDGESGEAKRHVPRIAVRDAGLESWHIAASGAPDVRVEPGSARNARQITATTGKRTGKLLFAYEASRPDYSVEFDVTPVTPEAESVFTQAINIRRERIFLDLTCFFRVKRGRKYEFRATLPASWEILEVNMLRGGGFDHTVVKEDGQNVIRFASSLGIGPGDAIAVDIRARLVPGETGEEKWQGMSFALPQARFPETTFAGGTVALGGADYLALSAEGAKSLLDMDIMETGISEATLAYRALDEDYGATIMASKKAPRLIAGVTSALSISERVLGCRALVRMQILESPMDSFRIALPAGTGKLVQFYGKSIKERTLLEEGETDIWKITLQQEIQGTYFLDISFDRQIEGDSGKLEAPDIRVLDVYRQDGYVAVEAGEGMEIGAETENMEEVYISEVPELSRIRSQAGTGIFVHAFRYSRPERSLKLDVRKHELQEVITCVVPYAGYTTLYTESGLERTEAIFHVRSVGEQFFSFKLPEGSVLWSVLLGRDVGSLLPVKPLSRAGKVLVPLTAASGAGNEYFVKAVYQRPHDSMGVLGKLSLDVPQVAGGPVMQMRWDTYLPEGYRYYGHAGAATYATGETSGETVFDDLYYIVLITAAVLLVLYSLGYAIAKMPKIRLSFNFGKHLGCAALIVLIVAIISAISIPNLLESKSAANEAAAISALRTISSAEELYNTRYSTYGSLGSMEAVNMIDSVLADATHRGSGKSGYYFELYSDGEKWWAYAKPTKWGITGSRSFYIDHTGVIQYTDEEYGEYLSSLGNGDRVAQAPQKEYDYGGRAESPSTGAMPPTHEPLAPRTVTEESISRKKYFGMEKKPESERMVEKPSTELEEMEKAKGLLDLYKDSPADKARRNSFLSGQQAARPLDFIFLQNGQRMRGRIAGRGAGAINFQTDRGPVNIPLNEVDSIRHANGRFESVAARRSASKQGLFSMVINLQRSGSRGSWKSLSGGGTVTMNYAGRGLLYTLCFIFTFASMLIFIALEKKHLRMQVFYAALVVIIFGILPAILGGHHYAFSNAVLLGLLLGIAYYQVRNLLRAFRAAVKPVIISAGIILLAGMLLFPAGQAQAQEKEKELPPIKATDMVVPYDAKDLLRIKGTGNIVLSEERYMKLLERAGLIKKIATERPPVSACISSAWYEATLLSDRLDVGTTYKIAVLEKGEQKVDIGLNGLAISSATFDGKPATLAVSEKGGYLAVIAGPVRGELLVSFSLPRDPETAKGKLEFMVEPVSASVVDVRTGTDTDVTVVSATGGQSEISSGEAKLVRAALGPLDAVSISWQPHKIFAPGLGLRTTASSSINYEIDCDMVQFRGTYTYTAQGGELSAVSFEIPEGLQIYKVACSRLRMWRLVEEGTRRLEISLHEDTKNKFFVDISGIYFPENKKSQYPLPFPRCLDVEREMGTVTVSNGRNARLEIAESKGLRRIQSGMNAPAGYELHSTYSYLSHPLKLEVAVSSKETELRVQTTTLLVLGFEQAYMQTVCELRSGGSGIYELFVKVPADFEVRGVSCSGMETYFYHVGEKDARLHILIPGGLAQNASLVLEGIRKGAPGEKEKIPAVEIAGAKVHRGEIAVAAEPGLMINTGPLEGISPVGKDKVGADRSKLGLASVQQAFKYMEEGFSGELLLTRLKPRLSATAVTALTVRGEVLGYAAILEYGIENAGCQEFRFKIPAAVKESLIIQATFLREKIFSEPDGDENIAVTVKLQHEVLESYGFVIYWEADPKEGETLTVPAIEPLGVETKKAYIVVQASAALRYMDGVTGGVDAVDSKEVPYLKKFETQDTRVLRAYKAQEFPYVVAFELERPKKAAELEAIIDNAEYTAVINDSAFSYNRAQFHVQNRAKQYLKLQMPEGAQLWTAEVANVPVKPAKLGGEGSTVMIPLLKRSEEDISYFVSVYYGLKLTGGFGSSIEPKFPEPVDIRVEETYVSVYMPEKYSYSFDTDMDEVIGSVREVAKARSMMADAMRITDRLNKEKDSGVINKLTSSLDELNEMIGRQLTNVKKAQRSAKTGKESFDKQRMENAQQVQELESDLTRNTEYNRQAQKLLDKLRLAEKQIKGKSKSNELKKEQSHGRKRGQADLDKFAQKQQERVETQQKQRSSTSSLSWRWQDNSNDESGYELQDAKKGELHGGREETLSKRRSLRPELPMERPVPDNASPQGEALPEEELPPGPAPEFFEEPGNIGRATRAAGVQPLRIELPESGIAYHFKKLGRKPELTLYSSTRETWEKLGCIVRLLVGVGLLVFCAWKGLSLFGERTLTQKFWEGFIATLAILLTLGSTAFALIAAGIVVAYIIITETGWLRTIGIGRVD